MTPGRLLSEPDLGPERYDTPPVGRPSAEDGPLWIKHLLPVAVAGLFGLSALWYGGFPSEVTAAISILAWWVLLLGSALGLLPRGNLDGRAITVGLLFGALGVLTALSIGWAADGGRAFAKTVQISSVIGLFALGLLVSRPADARGWAAGITGGLTIIALLAIFSRFFPGLGDDLQLTANLSGVEGRLSWPLGYWNATGAAAGMAIVGLVWFAVHSRTAIWRSAALSAVPLAGLVIYLTSSRGAVAACLAGIFVLLVCGPRRRSLGAAFALGLAGSMILIVIAASMGDLVHAAGTPTAKTEGLTLLAVSVPVVALIALLWYRYSGRLGSLKPWKPRPITIVIAALAAVAVLAAINPVARVNDFLEMPDLSAAEAGDNATTAHLLSVNGSGRAEFWRNAIDAFESKPVTGIGAGGYDTFYAQHRENGLTGQHAHSLVLQVFAELGAIGGLVVIGIIALTVIATIDRIAYGRLPRSGLVGTDHGPDRLDPSAAAAVLAGIAAAGATSMAVDWTAEFPVIVAPVVLPIAAIVGPATRPDLAGTRVRQKTLRADLLATFLILLGGASIWVAATGFRLDKTLDASRDAVSGGNYALAAEKASRAIEILPDASAPRLQLALVLELEGEYRRALKVLDQAIERDPESSPNFLVKARILLRLDRDREADRAFGKARSLDPEGEFFRDLPAEPGEQPAGEIPGQ